MTDPLTLLRDADPAARVPDREPPREVLERIVAAPPPRRRPARRRFVVAVVAGAAAVAALLGVLVPGDRADLAARAYAATAPGDFVLYTELYGEMNMPGHGIERDVTRIWQRGDQSRRVRTQPRGGGRAFVFEYVLDDGVLRVRLPEGEIQTARASESPEARDALETELISFVDSFRARYAKAELRDAGPTMFDGRPARAYESRRSHGERETYYLDPETGMPLGTVVTFPVYEPEPRGRRIGEGRRRGVARFTQILRKFERLPATPENLARLTAPWAERQPR